MTVPPVPELARTPCPTTCGKFPLRSRRSRRTHRQTSQECGAAPSTLSGCHFAPAAFEPPAQRWDPAPPTALLSTQTPAICCIWTSRNWGVSTEPGPPGRRITASRTLCHAWLEYAAWRRMTTTGSPFRYRSQPTKAAERLCRALQAVLLATARWRHLQAKRRDITAARVGLAVVA